MRNSLRFSELLFVVLTSIILIDSCKTGPSKKTKSPEIVHFEDSILTKRIQWIKYKEALVNSKIKNLNLDNNDSIISLIDTINFLSVGGIKESIHLAEDSLFSNTLDSLHQQSDDKDKVRQSVLFPLLRKVYVRNLNRDQNSVVYSTDGSTLYCKVDNGDKEDLIQLLIENNQCYLLRFKKIVVHSSDTQDEEHFLDPPKDSEPGWSLHYQ